MTARESWRRTSETSLDAGNDVEQHQQGLNATATAVARHDCCSVRSSGRDEYGRVRRRDLNRNPSVRTRTELANMRNHSALIARRLPDLPFRDSYGETQLRSAVGTAVSQSSTTGPSSVWRAQGDSPRRARLAPGPW